MKNNKTSFEPEKPAAASPEPIRKSVLILTTLIALGALAVIVFILKQGKDHPVRSAGEAGPAAESVGTSRGASERGSPDANSFLERWRKARKPGATPLEPPPPAEAWELVKTLSEVNVQPGELTPEKAEKWQKNLVNLIERGTNAVSALEEFLQKGADRRFDSGSGTNLLGEPTLRIAFLKVLFDIPAPENVNLQAQVLRTTTDPDEIALLARQLEQQEPGKFREEIIKAASASLELARNGQLPGRDTSRLVKLLQDYQATGVK